MTIRLLSCFIYLPVVAYVSLSVGAWNWKCYNIHETTGSRRAEISPLSVCLPEALKSPKPDCGTLFRVMLWCVFICQSFWVTGSGVIGVSVEGGVWREEVYILKQLHSFMLFQLINFFICLFAYLSPCAFVYSSG